MSHRVHAPVNDMESPGLNPSFDRPRLKSEGDQLSPPHDPVLLPGQVRDGDIERLRSGPNSGLKCRRSGHGTEADGEMRTRGARFGESLLRAGALDDGFGGCGLGLAGRGAFEGVGQGPQVGAGACLDDVGGDAGA
jgi:hypothetical protein